MKKIVYILALLAAPPLYAQTPVGEVLASIEQNNTTLQALRDEAEAEKLQNQTGIWLDNPEVEFNYLWGNPGAIGNRKDLSVKQAFDFPTITGMKRRFADGQNRLVELQYRSDRIDILLEAQRYCIELIYYNALKRQLKIRFEHAAELAEAYKKRLDTGDANIIEYNKARLELSSVQGEAARVEVECNTLLAELRRLNAGEPVRFESYEYGNLSLPSDFNAWYAGAEQKSPVLEYVKQQVELNRQQVRLSRAEGLPTLSAGYMREKVVGQSYQGVAAGISVPLWANKNRVKQAKALVRASENRQADSRMQFYESLQNLYGRAAGLQAAAAGYRQSLGTLDDTALLQKALDAGEISLLDYVVGIGLYYDTVNQALAAERDYALALAELSAVEL